MKNKKIMIITLTILAVAAVTGGSIFAYRSHKDKKTKIEVYPIANMDWGWGDDSSYSNGTVTDDQAQSIKLEENDKVEEVYVKKGDKVSIGTPLLRLNMESANLKVDMKQLEVATAENDLTIASRELERLKATTPVQQASDSADEENNKQETVEEKTGDAYNIISKSAKAYAGKGTEDEPLQFLCTSTAYVTGDYLNYLKEKSYTGIFEIREGNKENGSIQNAWLVNGKSLDGYEADEKWSISSREEISDTDNAEDIEAIESENDENNAKTYTASELAKAIAEKEKEIRKLDISKRKAELELKNLQKVAGDGIVTATVNGTVASVQELDNISNDGSAFLIVRGEDSLYVTGTLSELALGDITVGQSVIVSSWESGQSYDATITEISTTPASSDSYSGEGNPNVSYYPYTATVKEPEGLSNGDSVDLKISQEVNTESSLTLEKAYVRTENGKSYVMIEGKDKRLKKQYVTTGKTIYGQAVQITSGLDGTEYIAFPYGKNVKEGVKVKETEDMGY